MTELEAAAHKQGFASLDGDRSAPSSTRAAASRSSAKKPTPDTERHQELLSRLDRISAQLAALRS